jgi:hypothetical protein
MCRTAFRRLKVEVEIGANSNRSDRDRLPQTENPDAKPGRQCGTGFDSDSFSHEVLSAFCVFNLLIPIFLAFYLLDGDGDVRKSNSARESNRGRRIVDKSRSSVGLSVVYLCVTRSA